MTGVIEANSPYSTSFLIKTDKYGNIQWIRDSIAGKIMEVPGGYAFSGNPGIIRTDQLGNFLWSKIYYDDVNDFEVTSDGGFIISGATNSNASGGPGDRDILLIKVDSNGTIQWSKAFGDPNSIETSYGVCQTPDGGYALIGGTTYLNNNNGDLLVIKTDALGNSSWIKIYPGQPTSATFGSQIISTFGVPGYVIIGYTQGFDSPLNGARAFALRLDFSGGIIWRKIYGNMAMPFTGEWLSLVEQTLDGGFIFSGTSGSLGNGNCDAWLIKTDPSGNSGCYEIPASPTPQTLGFISGPGGALDLNVTTGQGNPPPIISGNWSPPVTTLCYSGPLVTGLDPIESKREFNPYPNPSTGKFNLEMKGEIREIQVMDLAGKIDYQQNDPGSKKMTFDLSGFSEGIYLLQINTASGPVFRKIILE